MNAKIDLDEVFGYYLLEQEGAIVYNPKYVPMYGRYERFLRRLRRMGVKPELQESYKNSSDSMKFFATYPKDLSNFTLRDLRVLRANWLKENSSTSV